jgi:hypothetical protein
MFNREVLSFYVTILSKALLESFPNAQTDRSGSIPWPNSAYQGQSALRPLCVGDERPHDSRSADEGDKFASSHLPSPG